MPRYSLAKWLAELQARRACGVEPCRAGDDYESSRRNAELFEKRAQAARRASRPIVADFMHELRQQTRDTKRRGKSNREGAKNRSFRKHKANAPRVLFSCPAFDLIA